MTENAQTRKMYEHLGTNAVEWAAFVRWQGSYRIDVHGVLGSGEYLDLDTFRKGGIHDHTQTCARCGMSSLGHTLQNLIDTAKSEHHSNMWGPYYILDVSLAADVEVPPYNEDFTVVVHFTYNWRDENETPRMSEMVYGLMNDGLWACWMD